MRDLCATVVGRLGPTWTTLGWGLFLGQVVLPFLHPWAHMALFLFLLAWWVIDLVDQQTTWWIITVGVVMLVIGLLPRGGILFIAAWVLYWFRLRE
jgi:hypothetical protein